MAVTGRRLGRILLSAMALGAAPQHTSTSNHSMTVNTDLGTPGNPLLAKKLGQPPLGLRARPLVACGVSSASHALG